MKEIFRKALIVLLLLAFMLPALGETVEITGDVADVETKYSGGSYKTSYTMDDETYTKTGNDLKFVGDATMDEKDVSVNVSGDATHALTIEVTGDADGVEVKGGATTVIVDGNVSGSTATGVCASEGAQVEVGGGVDGLSVGVDADGEGTGVTVSGDVSGTNGAGVFAKNGAEVTVEDGSVSGKQVGADASGGAIVIIAGTAEAQDKAGTAIHATGEETYVSTGDATAAGKNGIGVSAGDGASVTVSGDVNAGNAAIVLSGEDNTLCIGGSAEGKYAFVYNEDDLMSGMTSKILIEENLSGEFGVETAEGIIEADDDQLALMAKMVYYLVNRLDMQGASLSGTDTTSFDEETAHEGDCLLLVGKNIRKVDAGETAEVIKNEDGSYTIMVGRGCVEVIVSLKSSSNDTKVYKLSSVRYGKSKLQLAQAAEGEGIEIIVDIEAGEDYLAEKLASAIVKLDGEEIEDRFFALSLRDGQLCLSLVDEYLATLPEGSHELEILTGGSSFELLLQKAEGEVFIPEV